MSYLPKNNPIFIGDPRVPTATQGDNDTTIASTAYVDAAVGAVNSSVDWKDSVDYATAAALPANTRTSNTLDADANGALSVDGQSPSAGEFVIVKDEGDLRNGIYVVDDAGSAGTPWAMTRRSDADADAEVTSGMTAYVEGGTANGATIWTVSTADPITVNTTTMVFVKTGEQISASALSDLTDADTTGVVDGSFLRYESGSSEFQATTGSNLLLSDAGQLQVPTTGASAGILLGGDALIYRSAADELRSPDSLVIDGDITLSGEQSMNSSAIDDGDSPYSVAAGDYLVLADPTSGAITVNLPAVASSAGRVLVIKDSGGAAETNNITIDGDGAETIDGATTFVLDINFESARLFCDGSAWFLV